MRGLKKGLALILASAMILSSIGINGISFAEGSSEEGVISNMNISEQITGAVAEVSLLDSDLNSDSFLNQKSQYEFEYKITSFEKNKFSINDKNVKLNFSMSTPGFKITKDDIDYIKLICSETRKVIGEMNQNENFKVFDGWEATNVSGEMVILTSPTSSNNYEILIKLKNCKASYGSMESSKVTFSDKIEFGKLTASRSVLKNNETIYQSTNDRNVLIELKDLCNIGLDCYSSSSLYIEDEQGNKVGSGKIQYYSGQLVIFYDNSISCTLLFSFDQNYSIENDKKYYCNFEYKDQNVIKTPLILTDKFVYDKCKLVDKYIRDNKFSIRLENQINVKNSSFKLRSIEESKEYDLLIINNDNNSYKNTIIFNCENIPFGAYELYSTSGGGETKIDLADNIISSNTFIDNGQIDDKYIEVGTNSEFTKYSFPVYVRIDANELSKETINKLKSSELNLIISNEVNTYYSKKSNVKVYSDFIYIVGEFGDENLKNGMYSIDFTCKDNNDFLMEFKKNVKINLFEPELSLISENKGNTVNTNITKFDIDNSFVYFSGKNSLAVFDQNDIKLFEVNPRTSPSFNSKFSIDLRDDKGNNYGSMIGYNTLTENFESYLSDYSTNINNYKYTYYLDDLIITLNPVFKSEYAEYVNSDVLDGLKEFSISLNLHDVNSKDDFDIYLIDKINDKDNIVAASVKSTYLEYIDNKLINSGVCNFSLKTINGEPLNIDDLSETYIKIINKKSGNEQLIPIDIYSTRCSLKLIDKYKNQMELEIDPQTIINVDCNKSFGLVLSYYTYNSSYLGTFKHKNYIRMNSKLDGNKLIFDCPKYKHISIGSDYTFELIQGEKVLYKSNVIFNDTDYKVDISLMPVTNYKSDEKEILCKLSLYYKNINFSNEDVESISLMGLNKQIGRLEIEDSYNIGIGSTKQKSLKGRMIFEDKIEDDIDVIFNLKDGRKIDGRGFNLSFFLEWPHATVTYAHNSIYNTSDNFVYIMDNLDKKIVVELSNLVNVEDKSRVKVRVEKLVNYDAYSIYRDRNFSLDSVEFKESENNESDRKLRVSLSLKDSPEFGDTYMIYYYYDSILFAAAQIKYNQDFYAEDVKLISKGNISTENDAMFFLIHNSVNIHNIKEILNFEFISRDNKNLKTFFNNDFSTFKIGEKDSNDYLLILKTNKVPVGNYDLYFGLHDKSFFYRDIVSTNIPRVNNSANYTYVGNSLKEITVYGANLDSRSNYKVYVYKFDSRSKLSNDSGIEKAYIPELVKVIDNVRVNENSDISILKDDLKTLRNGEYSAFFEKDSKLVGSCNISIDEVSLDNIIDFEINGGGGTTSTRNISILTKLNGCNSIRYSDDLATLKQQPYNEVTKDEYSKGVAIRALSLKGNNGKKTIYMQLKDSKGVESEVISKEIILDIPVEKPVDKNNGSTNGNSSSGGSSGGSYGGGGGYVPPVASTVTVSDIKDNSTPEKQLSDISNLAQNIKSKEGVLQIEKKIDEVSKIILKEKDDKKLQNLSAQVNKEIINLSKNLKGKKDLNIQKVIEMMGEASLKAIDNIDDTNTKFKEYKSLAGTFAGAGSVLENTDALSKFKSELIRKASMTAVQAKTSVQYGEIIPKYVLDYNKISDVYSSKKDNYKDLESLSNNLLNGSKYIDVKNEMLIDLEDNKDLKISKVELKKDAIKGLKEKNIDVINIKSDTTLISIDPNNIKDTTDYNLVISNRKNIEIKEIKKSKINFKSLSDKNYLDINLFVGNMKVNNFEKPIKLSFNVDDYVASTDLEDMKPMVYCYDDKDKVWEPIGGKYDVLSGTITVVRKDLAKYTVLPVSSSFNESSLGKSSVSREDFITLIGQNYGFSALSNDTSFEDIDNNSESAKFISAAYEIGIVNGKGEKTFEPDGTLTYEEAAVIIARTLTKLDNKKVDKSLTENLDKIDDNNQISSWARDEFALVYELGLLNENAVKNPKSNVSKEELKLIIENL